MPDPTGHADIEGVRIGGQIIGSGPPLLLLHGLAGSWAEWQPNLPALTRHFKVYAPTMPGHGDSAPVAEYNIASGHPLFMSFLESEGMDKVSLVGHSMGGAVALDLALNFPERVDKLVLMDAAGMGSEIHWGLRLLSLPVLGEVVCDFLWPMLWPRVRSLTRRAGMNIPNPSVHHGTPNSRGSIARLLRAGVGLRGQKLWPANRDRLPGLQVPTLIIWGDRDELFPLSQAIAARRLIPNSRLHVLRRCGHCPGPEHTDEINGVLLEFLELHHNDARKESGP